MRVKHVVLLHNHFCSFFFFFFFFIIDLDLEFFFLFLFAVVVAHIFAIYGYVITATIHIYLRRWSFTFFVVKQSTEVESIQRTINRWIYRSKSDFMNTRIDCAEQWRPVRGQYQFYSDIHRKSNARFQAALNAQNTDQKKKNEYKFQALFLLNLKWAFFLLFVRSIHYHKPRYLMRIIRTAKRAIARCLFDLTQ